MKFDYKHPDMRFLASGRKMEIDVWIPSIKVGIEYQDDTHFSPHMFGENAYRSTIKRDAEKRLAAPKADVTLLEVSYKEKNGMAINSTSRKRY